MTFNRGGPVDCSAPAFEICSPSSVLTAVRQGSAGPSATLLLSPDAGGWLTLSFADRGGTLPAGVTLYHVMRAERLGFGPATVLPGPPALAVLPLVEACPATYPRRTGLPAKRPLW